ncbi:hypothetical protein CJF42_00490 [Pseudoalteromonas sp. NBT06-2]|uniref:golvesin C-terminal-like domain-containing protein n=1 Tax=Pseudoalteromonas sp. NBT06-2 TaxID=2025950 RepID=UPI000BA531A5|nr:hypothetical protein [Pseudoalteromonas sp. NBT06-2]PAJ76307.1 hypothetical protein CJF42_00490 [Pseudoalteromonas sp. NBT06-2]
MIIKNLTIHSCSFFMLSMLVNPAYAESENLINFAKGTIPIIITAPHGGSEQPIGVEPRVGTDMTGNTVERFNIVKDSWTKDIAEDIQAKYIEKYGGIPYIVTAKFHRKYIDANRPEHQAFETEAARPHYENYQNKITEYIEDIKQNFGQGILLDIHGQAQKPSEIIRGTRNGISVENLIATHGWNAVVGNYGFFGLLEEQGFNVEPSNQQIPTITTPAPEGSLSGGTTVKFNGSHNILGLDAIQFEIGSDIRFSESLRNSFTDNMSDNINTFMSYYYCESHIENFPCSPKTVIIDDDYKGYLESNEWKSSSAIDNYPQQGLSKSRYTNQQGETVSWQTTATQTGKYHVYAWWTNLKASGSSYSRDGSADYYIQAGNNKTLITRDQNSFAGQWVLLDTINAEQGKTIKVSLTRKHDGDEGSATVADAMAFVWAGI